MSLLKRNLPLSVVPKDSSRSAEIPKRKYSWEPASSWNCFMFRIFISMPNFLMYCLIWSLLSFNFCSLVLGTSSSFSTRAKSTTEQQRKHIDNSILISYSLVKKELEVLRPEFLVCIESYLACTAQTHVTITLPRRKCQADLSDCLSDLLGIHSQLTNYDIISKGSLLSSMKKQIYKITVK